MHSIAPIGEHTTRQSNDSAMAQWMSTRHVRKMCAMCLLAPIPSTPLFQLGQVDEKIVLESSFSFSFCNNCEPTEKYCLFKEDELWQNSFLWLGVSVVGDDIILCSLMTLQSDICLFLLCLSYSTTLLVLLICLITRFSSYYYHWLYVVLKKPAPVWSRLIDYLD